MFLPFYFKKNCAQLAFAKTIKSLFFHTFHFAFCCISLCVLQEIALRFVGDSSAFSSKTHCVLVLNALRFGAFRTALYRVFVYKNKIYNKLIYNNLQEHCNKTNPAL